MPFLLVIRVQTLLFIKKKLDVLFLIIKILLSILLRRIRTLYIYVVFFPSACFFILLSSVLLFFIFISKGRFWRRKKSESETYELWWLRILLCSDLDPDWWMRNRIQVNKITKHQIEINPSFKSRAKNIFKSVPIP